MLHSLKNQAFQAIFERFFAVIAAKIWIFSTKRSASWADVRCSVDHNESEGMKLRKLKMIKKRLVIDNAYKTL
jgi:hypothetical protein